MNYSKQGPGCVAPEWFQTQAERYATLGVKVISRETRGNI